MANSPSISASSTQLPTAHTASRLSTNSLLAQTLASLTASICKEEKTSVLQTPHKMDSFYDMKNNNTAYSSEPKLDAGSNLDSKHDTSKMNQASTNRNPRRRASKSSYFGHRAKQPSGSSFSSSSDKSEYNWPFTGEDGPTGPSQGRSDFGSTASECTPSQQMLLREIGAALTL